MRILFAGTPEIAAPSLKMLFSLAGSGEGGGYELAGVLTNPDSPQGRGKALEPSAVGAVADGLGVSVLKPEKLDGAARAAVAALRADILVSFAYGHIFGPKFLGLFPLGGINIHPSLLPKYRGPSPIQAAILNHDSETGVSIQRLAQEMDAGDLLEQERFPLSGRETTVSLSETAGCIAARLLEKTLRGFMEKNNREGKPQSGEISYCSTIKKEDGLIDWNMSAVEIDARARAFTAWPRVWTFHNGEKLFILEARALTAPNSGEPAGTVVGADNGVLIQTGDGILSVGKLQYQAKKPLEWKAFLNGVRNFTGSRLVSC